MRDVCTGRSKKIQIEHTGPSVSVASRRLIDRHDLFVACAETLANDDPSRGIDFTSPISVVLLAVRGVLRVIQ